MGQTKLCEPLKTPRFFNLSMVWSLLRKSLQENTRTLLGEMDFQNQLMEQENLESNGTLVDDNQTILAEASLIKKLVVSHLLINLSATSGNGWKFWRIRRNSYYSTRVGSCSRSSLKENFQLQKRFSHMPEATIDCLGD